MKSKGIARRDSRQALSFVGFEQELNKLTTKPETAGNLSPDYEPESLSLELDELLELELDELLELELDELLELELDELLELELDELLELELDELLELELDELEPDLLFDLLELEPVEVSLCVFVGLD